LFAVSVSGCATISTEKANLDEAPNGVRIYQPKVMLLVDTEEKRTTILFAPDYKRAYDIKPITVFAKQEFKTELEDGQLKTLSANQDTTAFLTFLTEAAELGTKAAGLPRSGSIINGTFGLPSGIYELTDDGSIRRVALLP
jgi:hypothetical protein